MRWALWPGLRAGSTATGAASSTRRLPQRRWLEHYAAQFATVENNGTFYRLPTPEVFASWRERVPGDFVMTVKASRYLTHIRRLRDPADPVRRLLAAAAGLGGRLGPVLLQLPPDLRAEPELLRECLRQFPAAIRVAVEPRHESWWTDEVRDVLAARDAALCWADRKGSAVTPLWRTAGWGYLRLHEGDAEPWPSYRDATLRHLGRPDHGQLGRRPGGVRVFQQRPELCRAPRRGPAGRGRRRARRGGRPGLARMGGGRVRLGDAARVVRRQGRQKGAAAAGRTARSA